MLRIGADKSTDEISCREYGILFTLAEIGGDGTERVWSKYGCSSRWTNWPTFPVDSSGCSTDVTDRVRMTFESTDVQPRRHHGDRLETTERVHREYGGCGESTQGVRTAWTQYG